MFDVVHDDNTSGCLQVQDVKGKRGWIPGNYVKPRDTNNALMIPPPSYVMGACEAGYESVNHGEGIGYVPSPVTSASMGRQPRSKASFFQQLSSEKPPSGQQAQGSTYSHPP